MNLLITGAWKSAKENIPVIEEMGYKVWFMQNEKDALPCDASDVDGVIGNGLFLSHSIEQFVNLQYIQLTSAGFDRVPMDYVENHGIMINNARGVYSVPIAEMVMSGVLQLYKQMRFFAENQKAHQWEKHRELLELTDKRILIVGTGSVGTECAKRFAAFDCNVMGVDMYPFQKTHYKMVLGLEQIDSLLGDADVVVMTAPLTEQTFHMMNNERFRIMKNSAIFVNVARGAIVDEVAIVDALKNNEINGAVLDVFENEPLIESELWDMKNVIITPHNSFVGEKNEERLSSVIKENLMLFSNLALEDKI